MRRKRLIALAVLLVLGAGAFVYGLRWLESAMTFRPIRVAQMKVPEGAEDVWFPAVDHTPVHGWFFKTVKAPATATVIYFHGNTGNISDVGWVGQRLATRHLNVLVFDYRGYGRSKGRANSEADLYADGDAALAFIVDEFKVPPEEVVLYGQSLGTTVVADVASRHKVGAIILESGLSSASSVADTAVPWLPRWLHFLGRNRFESARKLSQVHVPVLITHGDPDPVIPTEQARILFAAANEPKKLLIFPKAGHNVFGSLGNPYLDQVAEFIHRSIRAPH